MRIPLSTHQFAEEVLRTYESRVSQDWIDGLLFMTTAGGRIRICQELKNRIHERLDLSEPKARYAGAHVEAVLGDFGSGKSHIAFLLKHDLVNHAGNCLVMHSQMTGERSFSQVLARFLRSLHLGGQSSVNISGLEASGYLRLAESLRLGVPANITNAKNLVKNFSAGLDPAFCSDFITSLSTLRPGVGGAPVLAEVIENWVAKETNRKALESFEAILATFMAVGLATRCVIILDEFEALEALPREAQLEFMQSVQDLHDDFAFRVSGLPPFFATLFATPHYWKAAIALMPSMFSEGDRTRLVTALPPIEKSELYGLVDRYQTLYLLAGRSCRILDATEVVDLVDRAWTSITTAGRQGHMRTIHTTVSDLIRSTGRK